MIRNLNARKTVYQESVLVDNYTDLSYTGDNKFLSPLGVIGISTAMCTSRNGDFILVVGVNPDRIQKLNLSTPFDINTATFNTFETFDLTSFEGTPQEVNISDDGLNVFFSGQSSDKLQRIALPSYGDISNGVVTSDFIDYSVLQTPNNFDISPDGTRIVMSSASSSRIQDHLLSIPFDLSTAVLQNDLTTFNFGNSPKYLQFLDNGNTILFVNSGTDPLATELRQFDLLEPYSLNGLGVSTVPKHTGSLNDLFFTRSLEFYGDNKQAFSLGRFGSNAESSIAIIKYEVNL